MNRNIILLITLLITSAYRSAHGQPLAAMQFEQMDHNFGTIKEENGAVTYDFKFSNTAKIPLIIQAVSASCGCTTPQWSKAPVLPGKTGSISVSYNPEMRPGVFNKSITISANIPRGTVVLTISGEVIPKTKGINDLYPVDYGKIRLKSSELPFMKVTTNEIVTDTLPIYNPGDETVTINFKIIPPHLTIKTVPTTLPPKTKGVIIITFDASKKKEYGYTTNRIYLSFNKEPQYDHYVSVSATIEEDFSTLSEQERQNAPIINFDTKSFNFGEIKQGKQVDYPFKITNNGKRDLIIRGITTTCDCTAAQPASKAIAPGKTSDLKVTFDSSGKLGMQNKIIMVITNDPNHPTTILRILGTVKK